MQNLINLVESHFKFYRKGQKVDPLFLPVFMVNETLFNQLTPQPPLKCVNGILMESSPFNLPLHRYGALH